MQALSPPPFSDMSRTPSPVWLPPPCCQGYTYEVTSSTGLASGAGIEEGLDDDDPFLGPPASSGELFGPETTFVRQAAGQRGGGAEGRRGC